MHNLQKKHIKCREQIMENNNTAKSRLQCIDYTKERLVCSLVGK